MTATRKTVAAFSKCSPCLPGFAESKKTISEKDFLLLAKKIARKNDHQIKKQIRKKMVSFNVDIL